MKTEKEIGLVIRELRGEISLRDFAKKCDISHTTIDNLEKGVDFRTGKPTQAKITTVQKIADACGVSLSYIIDDNSSFNFNLQQFASEAKHSNIIIRSRDGSTLESELSDDQLELIKRMIEQFDSPQKNK